MVESKRGLSLQLRRAEHRGLSGGGGGEQQLWEGRTRRKGRQNELWLETNRMPRKKWVGAGMVNLCARGGIQMREAWL